MTGRLDFLVVLLLACGLSTACGHGLPLEQSAAPWRLAPHVSVRLDNTAVATANAFVRAQYVDHDCNAMLALMNPIVDGRPLAVQVVSAYLCPQEVAESTKDNDHLVAGSGRISRACEYENPEANFAAVIHVNECMAYTTIGRNHRLSFVNGKGVLGCDVQTVTVFLQHRPGQWKVIDETEGGTTENCGPAATALWRRRIPWR